jgi:hypothetical protein
MWTAPTLEALISLTAKLEQVGISASCSCPLWHLFELLCCS